ncbi:MFS transporter [Ectothiorhodospira haloalkaliphila]|uniref:MFS transporter n=1 Tax=Ectothiorhodospira haloalkaliphila TaxID=421628 RepID=W8KHG2_9GAMM|nr:MFS transporter [Ectothiorhodospira haloalkaliphila]
MWWVLRIFNGISVVGLYMVIESWLNERARHNRGQIFAVYMMICLVMLGVGQFLVLIYGPGHLASFALVAILFCLGLIPIALTPALQPTPIKAQPLSLKALYHRTPVGVVGALVAGIASGLSLFALWRILREPAVAPEEKAGFVPITRTSAVAAELDPRTEQQAELELGYKP